VHSTAVRTTIAPYPGRFLKRLEIAKDKAMSSEPIAQTHRASARLLPGIASAKLVNLLYIYRAV